MPVFQRGYVWNREQVRKLMRSLYKDDPIGQRIMSTSQKKIQIVDIVFMHPQMKQRRYLTILLIL